MFIALEVLVCLRLTPRLYWNEQITCCHDVLVFELSRDIITILSRWMRKSSVYTQIEYGIFLLEHS